MDHRLRNLFKDAELIFFDVPTFKPGDDIPIIALVSKKSDLSNDYKELVWYCKNHKVKSEIKYGFDDLDFHIIDIKTGETIVVSKLIYDGNQFNNWITQISPDWFFGFMVSGWNGSTKVASTKSSILSPVTIEGCVVSTQK